MNPTLIRSVMILAIRRVQQLIQEDSGLTRTMSNLLQLSLFFCGPRVHHSNLRKC